MLKGRPTGEIAVLLLTLVVVFILVIFSLAVTVSILVNPERDTNTAVGQIFDILTVILGAVVGYIAGRGTKAAAVKTNGEDIWDPTETPQPPPRRAETEQGEQGH
jgi:predicted Co/Zn/Cd cation transporter (cation efflux family)